MRHHRPDRRARHSAAPARSSTTRCGCASSPQDALAAHALARGEIGPAWVDALARQRGRVRTCARPSTRRARRPARRPRLRRCARSSGFARARSTAERVEALPSWTRTRHAAIAACSSIAGGAAGFVRACHGDLHLGNIATIDGRPIAFDAIEFDDDLRIIDVMSDVAFLVMDFRFRGRADLGSRFLDRYLEITGDYDGLAVLRFYAVYRALVRAMVACERARQGDAAAIRIAEAARYLDVARVRSPGRRRPSSSSRTDSRARARPPATQPHARAPGRDPDPHRRRAQAAARHAQTTSAAAPTALYSADATRAVYARARDIARTALSRRLSRRSSTATFLRRWQRDLFADLAAELGVPLRDRVVRVRPRRSCANASRRARHATTTPRTPASRCSMRSCASHEPLEQERARARGPRRARRRADAPWVRSRITLLLAVAFAAFAALAVRKLAILRHLAARRSASTIRWQRLRSVLVNGFLQSRMIRARVEAGRDARRDLPRLHDAARAQARAARDRLRRDGDAARHRSADSSRPAKDVVEIAVLAACGYALYRRLVQKPRAARAQPRGAARAGADRRDHGDGLRVRRVPLRALLGRRPRARARARVRGPRQRPRLRGRGPPGGRGCAPGYHVFYWLQIVVVLSFLVILPLGEHFHIVTALPALFFRRGAPANAVPYIDVEKAMEQDDVRLGARTARDLTWKEGLDAFTCTECGRCKDACPAFLAGMPLSQKGVNDAVKHHLVAARGATSCRDADAARPRARRRERRDAVVVHHLRLLRGRVPDRARAPAALHAHAPAPRDDRRRVPARAARGLLRLRGAEQSVGPARRHARRLGRGRRRARSRARRRTSAQADYLFYVGSAQSFDLRGQKIAAAFARIMQAAGVRIAILGARETSTGECVRRCGNEVLFQALARRARSRPSRSSACAGS